MSLPILSARYKDDLEAVLDFRFDLDTDDLSFVWTAPSVLPSVLPVPSVLPTALLPVAADHMAPRPILKNRANANWEQERSNIRQSDRDVD